MSSITRRVAHGTLRLLAGLLGAKVLDFAFYLVLARALGVAEFGRYVYALSFTLMFAIVADLGTAPIFVREVSRAPGRARTLLARTLAVRGLLATATLIVSLGIAMLARTEPRTLALVAMFVLGLVANSTAALFEGLLKSAGRAGQAGVAAVAQSVAACGLGTALVIGVQAGAWAGAMAYLVAALTHLVAAAWLARDLWRADREPVAAAEPTGLREHALALLRESLPIALSGVLIAVYFRIDAVMIHGFRGPHDTGLYGGIYRIFEAFVLVSAAYRSVLYPVMARAADGPPEQLRVLCRKSIRVHLLFTLAVATFFTFEARPIVTLILGPAYADAAVGLAILIWALPGAFIADTLLHLLTAQGRQAEGTRAAVVAAVFNVALNLLLVPTLSFVGASIATAATEVLCFALLFRAFGARVPGIGIARVAWRPVAGAAALGASLALLGAMVPPTGVRLAVALMLGGLTYVGFLAVVGELRSDEIRLVAGGMEGSGG